MGYLGNTVSDLLSGVFLLFFIAAAGTVLGSIKIKAFSLGSAGVLIAAVGYGAQAHCVPAISLGGVRIELFGAENAYRVIVPEVFGAERKGKPATDARGKRFPCQVNFRFESPRRIRFQFPMRKRVASEDRRQKNFRNSRFGIGESRL